MATGLLGISLSGLNAAQVGIRTTSQNIANINTEGYRRQEVAYSSSLPQYSGNYFVGNGIMVDAIRHQYNQFLDNQVLLNQTLLARYSSASDRASQLDSLLGDSSSSLSTSLNGFFDATQELANDPTSSSTRQNLLSAASGLASRFNMLSNQMQSYLTATNADVQSVVSKINTLSEQIAQANAGIAQSTSSNGLPANDLVDNRDQLVVQLNKLINVSTQDAGNGMINLYVGSGQSLVLGTSANTMGTTLDPNNPTQRMPTIDVSGTAVTLSSSLVSGGELGGILDFRENVLTPAIDDLNRMAMTVASEINAIQTSGLDFNLNPGSAFFSTPVTTTAGTTALSFSATLDSAVPLEAAGYTLTYNNGTGTYTLTGLSSGTVTTGASLAAVTSGLNFTLTASAAPVVNSSWTIAGNYARQMELQLTSTDQIAAAGATAGGPGDNSNALLMAALRSEQVLDGGATTFGAGYAALVSRTAVATSRTDLNMNAYQKLTDAAVSAQQSQVGVNLDEEAAKLIEFQQAYQASAKAMQVANSLFDSILNIL